MLFQKAQKKLNGNQNKIDRKNKERTRSLNRWYLSSPIGRILLTLSEKVSLCTSCVKIKKAGLSVETALVLPLFFLGMVTMISFMDICRRHICRRCVKRRRKPGCMRMWRTEMDRMKSHCPMCIHTVRLVR